MLVRSEELPQAVCTSHLDDDVRSLHEACRACRFARKGAQGVEVELQVATPTFPC